MTHKTRIEKLEASARPRERGEREPIPFRGGSRSTGRIVVQWPGEPTPEVEPQDTVLRVVYDPEPSSVSFTTSRAREASD